MLAPLLAASLLLAPDAATTAAPSVDPQGDWLGVIAAPNAKVRLAVHLQRQGQNLRGVVDSPDQKAFGLALANIRQDGAALSFDLPAVQGRYEGRWDAARQVYVGRWTQGGAATDLELKRGGYAYPFDTDWNAPADPGLRYTPAVRAKPRVGPDLAVGKCVNMSGTLDAPSEKAWGPGIAEDDFQIIRKAGFSTVRLPVAWSLHAAETPPYAIDPVFLARVKHLVDLASASGLNVILDVHNYDALDRDPASQTARYGALWRQIAETFSGAPPTVWFELLNEPHDALNNANLGALYAPVLKTIRATNPTRPVIVGGQWNNLDKMLEFQLPDDPYVVPSFHYYDPFLFTHQGAPWTDPTPSIGRPFGSAADRAELDANVAKAAAYIARTGRVPVLGEYGAQDDPRVPLAQRIRYYGAVSAAFASVGIDGCIWGYRIGFRIRDGDHWLPGMVEAIASTKP